jgi:wyosine [tRNA(Phe)-imidazoG37] synthetase (radical SAM superfamily)
MLSVNNHSRDIAGFTYVYPVISRRANGLSIGINLNPNNACNWRCIYCQVPELKRGSAPTIDLQLLSNELHRLLDDVQQGDFYDRFEVPEHQRQIRDIAISGNGEPTSAREFSDVVVLLGEAAKQTSLLGKINIVLITNGSLIHQVPVQDGLNALAQLDGEVWFKLDSATDSGLREINNASSSLERARLNLSIAVKHCPLWVQTCLFALDGKPPSVVDWQAYLNLLSEFENKEHQPLGVLLYGLARQSLQPEALRLERLSEVQMEHYAETIRALGYEVKVSY